MSGRAGRELNQDESLRGNGDGEGAVCKGKVLRRRRSACCAELGDLIASWERWAAHRVICFDHVSVIGIKRQICTGALGDAPFIVTVNVFDKPIVAGGGV